MTEFIASPMFARWFLRHPPRRSLLLCSPFLRGGTLERVLEFVGFPELRPEMELKVLFRGLKRDFLQGASDLAAVELLRRMERQCGGRVEVLLSELEDCLRYETASDAEKDYSVLGAGAASAMRGKCMYCNHCLPCPAQIDVAAVGRLLDMALLHEGGVPETAAEHYRALSAHAGDCIECRSCERNCPFRVPVVERMRRARELFGE